MFLIARLSCVFLMPIALLCRSDCAKRGSSQHCKGLGACSFSLFHPLFAFINSLTPVIHAHALVEQRQLQGADMCGNDMNQSFDVCIDRHHLMTGQSLAKAASCCSATTPRVPVSLFFVGRLKEKGKRKHLGWGFPHPHLLVNDAEKWRNIFSIFSA